MELLQQDQADVLSDWFPITPRHSQWEAVCRGLLGQTAVWSAALRHVENLKCGTMTLTGLWVSKPTSVWTQGLPHESPISWKTCRSSTSQCPLCCWRAQPRPSLSIALPALFQECKKRDIIKKVQGDGLHMASNWLEGTQRRISHGPMSITTTHV